jgi:hypothetical protein
MKKITIAIILGLLGVIISTASASAASSFQFSPASFNTNPGKTFTLTITLDPQGVKNYTAKAEISFPADLLGANSFTFGSNWMAIAQTGYDLTDNGSGILIKTAGYPGGASNPVTFGTISFTTKKEGSGTITITGNSFALDATNQNVLSNISVQSAVVVKKAAVTPITPTTSVAPEVTTTPQPGASVATPVAQTTPENNIPVNVGAASVATTGSKWANFLWIVLIIAIIACVVYVIYRLKGKKK